MYIRVLCAYIKCKMIFDVHLLANFDISVGEHIPFVPYFALSKNDVYVAFVSAAGKVSMFNWVASVSKVYIVESCLLLGIYLLNYYVSYLFKLWRFHLICK